MSSGCCIFCSNQECESRCSYNASEQCADMDSEGRCTIEDCDDFEAE